MGNKRKSISLKNRKSISSSKSIEATPRIVTKDHRSLGFYKNSQTFEAIRNLSPNEEDKPRGTSAFIKSYNSFAWVYSAIFTIANSAAGIPILAFDVNSDGNYIEDIDNPIVKLLNNPNRFSTGFDFIELTFNYLESSGNCFWEVVRNKMGIPIELYNLNPSRIKIIPDKKNFIKKYVFEINGNKIDFDADDIIHLKYPDPSNDYWGLAPLSAASDALAMEKSSIKWNRNFFANSARPDVIFNVEGSLNNKAFMRMKAMVKKLYSGVDNAYNAAVLEGGVKIDKLGFPPKDVEFLELRRFNRSEILSVFGVPPSMVGIFETAIRANAKEQRKTFWENTMVHKLEKVEHTINHRLVPSFSKLFPNKNIVLKFDLTNVEALGENSLEKTGRLVKAVNHGILSRNEARLELGYEYAGPELDVLYIPTNLAPAGEDLDVGPKPPAVEVDPNKSSILNLETRNLLLNKAEKNRSVFINSSERNVDKYFSDLEKRTVKKIRQALKGRLRKYKKNFNVESFFTESSEIDQLSNILNGDIKDAIVTSGNISMLELSVELSVAQNNFVSTSPLITDFINNRALESATSISTSTKNQLQRALTESFNNGDTIKQIEDRIHAILGPGGEIRASAIARTEISTAFSFGSRQGVDQFLESNQEVRLLKTWVSARDGLVRDTHIKNDEFTQETPIQLDVKYPFNNLLYPHDPSANAAEVVNCRCTEGYISGSQILKSHKFCKSKTVRFTTGFKRIKQQSKILLNRNDIYQKMISNYLSK